MLTKKELEKFKSLLGFNLGQIEKDYLQHLCLLFLSRYVKDELVFKGGTALQKIYGLNRFSEDLDFTLNKEINIGLVMKKIENDFNNFGFNTEIEILKSRTSKNYRLKIKGPLYDGTGRTIATVRIEVSTRKDLILELELKEIVAVYPDIQPYILLVMDGKEILAEKIRTILQREKARDVYDLWFLLRKNIRLDFGLIIKKVGFYNLKFDKTNFLKKMKAVKKTWNELSGYVAVLPDFNKITKEIVNYF